MRKRNGPHHCFQKCGTASWTTAGILALERSCMVFPRCISNSSRISVSATCQYSEREAEIKHNKRSYLSQQYGSERTSLRLYANLWMHIGLASHHDSYCDVCSGLHMLYRKSFLQLKMKGALFSWMVWRYIHLAHKGKHSSLLVMDRENISLSGKTLKNSHWKKNGGDTLCLSLTNKMLRLCFISS